MRSEPENAKQAADEWPPELQALAEQLSADAVFLVQCFPVSASTPAALNDGEGNPPETFPLHRPAKHGRRFLAAAVAGLVVSAWGWNYWSGQTAVIVQPEMSVSRVPAAALAADGRAAAASHEPTPPVVGFLELSAPEQEAVLDLLEDDNDAVQVSI